VLWLLIGVAYYAVFFIVLVRILRAGTTARPMILALIGAVLFLNALWNLFFFRTKKYGSALVLSGCYSAIVVVLFFLLFSADRTSALLVSAYALYLVYGGVWQFRLWQLNRSDLDRRE